jgi:hypothetical protein
MAEQQPLYLLAGRALIGGFGRDVLPLRLLSAGQLLLALAFLFHVVDSLFSWRSAVLTVLLVATSGMVYSLARLYRPDPMMFAWSTVGLGAALLAASQHNRRWWLASGLAYGVAFMWKPFAMLPVFGIALFFTHQLLRSARQVRVVAGDFLPFVLPFAMMAFLVNGALHLGLDLYYLENLRQHASLGRDLNPLLNLLRPPVAYVELFLAHAVFLFVLPLWLLNRPAGWRQRPEIRLLLWQMAVPVLFVALTRPFYPRYMIFLVPVFAILLAWQLDLMIIKLSVSRNSALLATVMTAMVLVFAVVSNHPRPLELFGQAEGGTMSLAQFVAEHSGPDDVVLSDYAGINFFAERRSIYEASIIAGGRIAGGIVTGSMLIDRMEQNNVRLVLLHVEGGDPEPHQLISLIDYEDFRSYLTEEYEMIRLFDRNGQKIEVYARRS